MIVRYSFAVIVCGCLLINSIGCYRQIGGKAIQPVGGQHKFHDAIVEIDRVKFFEWDDKKPSISKSIRPYDTLIVDVVVKRDLMAKPFKYLGWIDSKANADSKNYAILSDSSGKPFRLVKSPGIGMLDGIEKDVYTIDRPRTDSLTFKLPLETEDELTLTLSGWAFRKGGEMKFTIPVKDWVRGEKN